MSWDEAYDLAQHLLSDPTSHLHAAKAGWTHEASHEFRVLADTYDLLLAKAAGKKNRSRVKPYPRPWKRDDAPQRSKTSLPQSTIRAALAARGH